MSRNIPALLISTITAPPIIVPIIAYLVIGDHHPFLALGGGLALGICLAIVVTGLLSSYYRAIALEQRKESQQEKVREAVKAGDAVDIAIVNMQKLDEYYTLNRSQARNSFLASIVAVCVGFMAILIAARFAGSDPKQALAGALGGVLLNFIGGGFFVMYNKSLQQLNLFYGKLVQLQDTMLAVQQCDRLPEARAAEVRQSIILELIHRPVHVQVEIGAPKSAASKPRSKSGVKPERTAVVEMEHEVERRPAGSGIGRQTAVGAPDN